MKRIFYEKKSGIIAGQIIGQLKASAVENKTELYHTIRTLSQRLTRPIDGLAIMVLIAGGPERSSEHPCYSQTVWFD